MKKTCDKKTFKIVTFGCKVNFYESEAIKENMIQNGYEYTPSKAADIFVFNTCAVTLVAEHKCLKHIKSVARKYPGCQIVVLGCFAQLHPEQIRDISNVKVLIGSMYKNHIVEYLKSSERVLKADQNMRLANYEELKINDFGSEVRAPVKIQDGCDNFCSYCIIPYVRGKSRSRRPEEIKKEIQTLVNNGYQEIVITGIHTGGYGKDLNNYSFSRLIREILEETPDLYRLRISSIEATEIDDEFVNLLTKYINIANHLHIPLQSGSETVLKRMNRRYKICDYIKTIEKIRNACPDIALTTDVIVGFPGETEQEFQETVTLIEQLSFSELHVFPFSNRENTAAAKMTKQIDNSLKKERVSVLLDVSKKLHNAYESKYFGKELDVLFEDFDKINGTYRGHTSNYLEVHVKSQFDLEGKVCVVAYYGPQNSLVKKG